MISPIKILIADDFALVRARVCKFLRAWDLDITCAGAANGHEAILVAATFNPTLIILDVTMPVLDGFQAAIELKKVMPGVPILFFSIHDGQHTVNQIRRVGAQGFVVKYRVGDRLIPAIQALCGGGTYFI